MHLLFLILAIPLSLAGLAASIVVLIDMFQDSIVKGLIGILCCGLYVLYYAAFEYDGEYKTLVWLGFLCGAIGAVLRYFAR